jgi:hypothetical protein
MVKFDTGSVSHYFISVLTGKRVRGNVGMGDING